jgi:hypothetical protein
MLRGLHRGREGWAVDFELVLSLGPNCRAKHQILRAFPKEICPSSVFDWQVTPMRAVRFYLGNDFRGTFERAELEIADGIVIHRRLRTKHIHEFPEGIGAAEIGRYYDDARTRHEHLCAKTRAILKGKNGVLICLSKRLPFYKLALLDLSIRRYAPGLRFSLLNGPKGDYPNREVWQGDDALWDRHLAPYTSAM